MWVFLGKTSRKHLGVQNVAELVEILGIYELYRSPTIIFLSSSNISWMNSLPFACWQEVWTCRFFEPKQRSYEAHSVEKSAKKVQKKNFVKSNFRGDIIFNHNYSNILFKFHFFSTFTSLCKVQQCKLHKWKGHTHCDKIFK